MRLRRAALLVVLPVLASLACSERGPARDADPRPNVVLIYTDDQRWDALGCTGNPYLETPSLDRLAREGALFANAFVTTSLCSPSRATLMTGKYAHVHGVHANDEDPVAGEFLDRHVGFPVLLQRAGYETAFVGKWHMANPGALPQPGFDHWVSFEGQGGYKDTSYTVGTEQVELPGFGTDTLTDLAIEWLREPRERPFLLILSVKNCHRPYSPPERHRGALESRGVVLPVDADAPPEDLATFARQARDQGRNGYFPEEGPPEDAYRRYLELVLSIDDNVGRLLDALEETGELERSAVFLTSDHGFLWGEHGMYRKRAAFEPALRVPLLARWPAEIAPGTVIDELVLNVDLAPTFLHLAGAAIPADLQGRSLRPLWLEDDAPWRERFLYLDAFRDVPTGPLEMAVRDARWKYVRYRAPGIEERLFDLDRDPGEHVNRARDPEQAERLEALRREMRALLTEVRAPDHWWDPVAR